MKKIPSASVLTLLVAQLAPEAMLNLDSKKIRSVVNLVLKTARLIENYRLEWVEGEALNARLLTAKAAQMKAEILAPYALPAKFPAKMSEFSKNVIGYKGAKRTEMLERFMNYYLCQPDRVNSSKQISAKDFIGQLVAERIHQAIWFDMIRHKAGFTKESKSEGAKIAHKKKAK